VIPGRNGDSDVLYCFDANKGGAPLWKAEYAAPGKPASGFGAGARGSPCIDGECVYAFGALGHLTCLSLVDGKIIWQKDVRKEFGTGMPWAGYASSPLVAGGLVIVQVCNKAMLVAAFRKDNGEKAWASTPTKNENYSSVIKATFNGVEQIVGFSTDGVRGLDIQTGKEIWNLPSSSSDLLGCTPTVERDTVFAISGRNAGCRALQVNEKTATKLWDSKLSSNHSDPVISNGYLYGFAGASGDQGDLRCLELKTGTEKWATKDLGRMGTVVLVDGALLCLTYSGDVFLVSAQPDAFKKIAEFKGAIQGDKDGVWTVPVVASGKLYLHFKSVLICYDLMP
jgi:outer membrane protein assembly factor BamB